MKTIVYYHKNCFDGMAAAWIVRRYLESTELDTGKWEFIPVQYGDVNIQNNLLQDCYENANINDRYIIVDFSFPRDLMKLMADKAKSILVLDHHKTAEEACKGLDFCIFDMNQSGAGLAWRHFFLEEPVPNLIKYIEDRDLWLFKLPSSKEINAYIQSYPQDIEVYERLATELDDDPYALEAARNAGQAIERYKQSMVETMCSNARPYKMSGFLIPIINSTLLFSEVGHYMCQQSYSWLGGNKPAFAASFFIRNDGKKQWSLRSIGDFDVSAIAKMYGGGGHRNAAGFEENLLEISEVQ